MVAVFRMKRSSAQEAFNKVSSLVDARFLQWDDVVKARPSWGEDVDSHIQQYIQSIQNIVQANLSWR